MGDRKYVDNTLGREEILMVYSGRWAMIFDKDGKVIYAENEKNPGEVDVSLYDFS
jgi:peroxiredoxin